MRYYISFDGGGTKLQGILFDENYRVLSSARAGGVNISVYKPEKVAANMRSCIRELLDGTDEPVTEIEAIYSSQGNDYKKAVEEFVPCKRFEVPGEGTLGVLTSGLTSGICALSGTGSDLFHIEEGRQGNVLGGWGYLMGDRGSGFAIGKDGLCLVLSALEGVREPSVLDTIIREQYGFDEKEKTISSIYNSASPAHFVASFAKHVNEAAQQGDTECKELLYEAGFYLGSQGVRLLRKEGLPEDFPFCTTGSIFRYSEDIRRGFEESLKAGLGKANVHYPMFEPVVGGILYCMMEHGEAIDPAHDPRFQVGCAKFKI